MADLTVITIGPRLPVDSEGTQKGDGVGRDAIQTNQIKVYSAEEREGGRQVPL